MPASSTDTKEKKRINLTLPSELYKDLKEVVQEEDLTYTEAIRRAVSSWLDRYTRKKMAEGYRLQAEENLDMLSDFEHVDRENW